VVNDSSVDREFVMKDGTKIYAQVEQGGGKGHSTPVVLIHGWGFCHLMWDTQINYLKDHGHPVVAIDLRGFGNSDESKTGYSYQTWARDIGEVMTQLGMHDDVTLAGYSMGGAIAMYYVANGISPSVKRLVLIAAAGPCMQLGPCPYGHMPFAFDWGISLINLIPFPERFIASYPREMAFRWLLDMAFGLRSPPTRSWEYRWLYVMFASASKEALIGGIKEIRNQNLTTSLSTINIPTRILHGKLDLFANPGLATLQYTKIAAQLKDLFWCERSGHGLFFEQADKLNEKLEEFAR
jgi:pimeloyl-ACP methyl ester carboxylesterase